MGLIVRSTGFLDATTNRVPLWDHLSTPWPIRRERNTEKTSRTLQKVLEASLKYEVNRVAQKEVSSRFSVFRLCNSYESGTIMGLFFDPLAHSTRTEQ